MGKLDTFLINFDQPLAVYFPGQLILGFVELKLKEPVRMRGISMKLLGRAYVHWTVTVRSNKSSRTYHYTATEIYFNDVVSLFKPGGPEFEVTPLNNVGGTAKKYVQFWGLGERTWRVYENSNDIIRKIDTEGERRGLKEETDVIELGAGTYRYPFTLQLPATLPGSFEGRFGYIRYTAEGRIDRPWRFDFVTKSAFTVVQMLNLNHEPIELTKLYEMQQNKDVSCCCFIKGAVEATIRMNKRCFVPGETLRISGLVVNHSTTKIKSVTAMLVQHIDFYGMRMSATFVKQWENLVASSVRGRIEPGKTDEWSDMTIVVPALPPSRLDGCQIIKNSYWLKVVFAINCKSFEVRTEVLIGSVPHESSAQNSQLASQATYEEFAVGRVNIKDAEDSNYLMGNLSWAPRYPTYHSSTSTAPV